MRTASLALLIFLFGSQPAPELRVMTYNIKHGEGNDATLDLDRTIAVIRAHRPDVVALQEVDRFWARSGFTDQPLLLAKGLGFEHHCFAANLDHGPDAHSDRPHQYGTAIVSRFPLAECSNTLLPTFEGWEQRGLLGARVDIEGVHVRVYSTHLQAGGEKAAPQRVLQVQEIVRRLSGITEPIVLMGDFNAVSASAEMKPLYEQSRDVWRENGAGEGYTSPARLEGNPTSRIDYIFVSPRVSIREVYVPLDAQTRLASDHYPVVAQITVQ